MNEKWPFALVMLFVVISFVAKCKKALEPLESRTPLLIAFTSDRDGDNDIYTMNDKGGEVKNLTNNTAYEYPPKFSPDGSKIIFVSNQLGPLAIYIMNFDGTNESFLEYGFDPNFSPDGSSIVFERWGGENSEICSMDISGNDFVNLTNNNVADGQPVFSPDGSKIVYLSDIEDNSYYNFQLFIMNSDGTNQINLSNHPSSDESPIFQP